MVSSYWDKLSGLYTGIGESQFWLRHRRRLTKDISGRVLEVCCGGGQLVLEFLLNGVDVYGIDNSPKMVALARSKLQQNGFGVDRIIRADVTNLPFTDGSFDYVISTGAIALFRPPMQYTSLKEMARVARCEVRLLESYEKGKGVHWARVAAFVFDGMRPISTETIERAGLQPLERWRIMGGAFSYVQCVKK